MSYGLCGPVAYYIDIPWVVGVGAAGGVGAGGAWVLGFVVGLGYAVGWGVRRRSLDSAYNP